MGIQCAHVKCTKYEVPGTEVPSRILCVHVTDRSNLVAGGARPITTLKTCTSVYRISTVSGWIPGDYRIT